MPIEQAVSRRRLLGGALAIGSSVAFGGGAALASVPEKRLALRNVHTGERIDACWWKGGQLDHGGVRELCHGLRDWRTGEKHPIDGKLFDLLTSLRDRLGVDPRRPFDLISGYRSPHTNAGLRAAGGAHTGVASHSQHMLGKATDLAMPGIALDHVRLAALSMKRGGVGFYPRDGFVHVDTGPVRHW